MFEVIHNDRILFRNVSIARCKQFIARHELNGAIVQLISLMAA